MRTCLRYWMAWLGLPCVVAAVLLGGGCRASRPETTGQDGLRVSVDVVPLLIPADTTQRATVWVTVLDDGLPVPDSTVVNLVATLGTVPSEVYTNDGLGVAAFKPPLEAGVSTIVAQAQGIRDSVNITVY